MTERYRITSIKTGKTMAGRPVIELYGDTRLKFPVLQLFDPSMLITIGIDPASITAEKTPVTLWAYYEISEKLKSTGTPYKDIVTLERIDTPATATSTDNTAILGELRAIKALLLQLTQQDPPQPDTAKAERLRTLAHAGSPAPPAVEPETIEEPETSNDARTEFYRLGAKAMDNGSISHTDFNTAVNLVNGEGYTGALAALKQKLA